MKKYLAIFLFLLSICFLIPGVTHPLMTIKATIDKQQMFDMVTASFLEQSKGNFLVENMINLVVKQFKFEGTAEVFESTRSLVETMEQLIAHDYLLVGILIGLFGVVIPVFKIILTLVALISRSEKVSQLLFKFSSVLSKWSMSDVFVMAILVAFLTVNANEHSINTVHMNVQLGEGFYYFATYCLLAILAGQLFQFPNKKPESLP